MMSQIAVGNTIAPMTIEAKIRNGLPDSEKTSKMITETKRRGTIVFDRLIKPFLPSAFHLFVYTVTTVQAVGMASTVRIITITASILRKGPELRSNPIHTSAVKITSEIAVHFIERPKVSCFSATDSRSL